MKKLFLTLCLVAFVIGSMNAGLVDQQKAQQLGAKFLGKSQLRLVATVADRGVADYYAFNVSNGEGFVIVAADDRVKPILAYSTTGHFDPDQVSDGFQFTLDAFREEIQYVREHNLSATPDIIAEWESVCQAHAVVGPLCQTLWDQDSPWNSQCPQDPQGPGGHVYAGCIATALGMVMKYHDWPNHGEGSHTYSFSGGYGQQTANFGETDYHFELMPYTLDSLSTEEDFYYIAQLLRHIGIAVEMVYGPYASVSSSGVVGGALRSYFRYNCDVYKQKDGNGNPYSNEEWAQMLKNGGLDEHLPLFYSGSDDNSGAGHAFVCDGYDENDYFHFNWGLSGSDNAWCPIGALNYASYSFNTETGFTGHIIPKEGEYYSRPDSIVNMKIVENADFDGVKLQWTNPMLTVGGDDLASITSVTIRRNRVVIAELTDAPVGADMEYEDNVLETGLYEYAIYVTNEAGISQTVYRSVIVGEKCDITFQLHDAGGDGWKGASISVTSESGQRIAIVGMDEGSEKTVTLPLLKGNLNFVWNSGWFHIYPGWDTDDECSFSILNADGEEVYTSTNLQTGVFFTYENDCEPNDVAEVAPDESVQVYPNPTSGLLHVCGNGTMHITVTNLLGQKIMEVNAEGNTTLDLNGNGSGIYLVRIESANGVKVNKINLMQ
ncbi:MAG: thiol protease/hemagglutinin PrtT [Bacteroidales bacterium]|nr:thiol protease/hemagglutinin PrtT [Bacteroidales bacterium]